MIPTGNLVLMAVEALLGFAIPICLAWWLIKKYKVRLSTVLIGAATFVVFALVLEALVHQIVLKGPYGATIQGKTLYYALYGGLMAGLFEETGRFLSMKFLMKKEPTTVLPSLAYGAGHGGVEMLVIFGFAMISNLSMSIMINAGQTERASHRRPSPGPVGTLLRPHSALLAVRPRMGGRPEGREVAVAFPGSHPAACRCRRPSRPAHEFHKHGRPGDPHLRRDHRHCGHRLHGRPQDFVVEKRPFVEKTEGLLVP